MSKRDEFINGANSLRLAQIKESLERLRDTGFEREVELLESEVIELRRKIGIVYDSAEPLFLANLQRKMQHQNAAMARHKALEEYKLSLVKWARKTYLKDRKESADDNKNVRSKRHGKSNAADWLLRLYEEDRAVEQDDQAIPQNAESANDHGSPEPPVKPVFNATRNFFYQAIKNLS